MLLFIATIWGPWLLAKSLRWLCILVPGIATQLCIIIEPETMDVSKEDSASIWASEWRCVFFIVNIVVSVLWYSLRYSSNGPTGAGWTAIFG